MPSETELGFQINTLAHCIRRKIDELLSQAQEEGDSVTGIQGRVLGYLYDHREQDLFQRDLERAFHVRRSTATGLLQLMERNGLITRSPVPYDARLKKLCLTEKALRAHTAAHAQILEMERRLRRGRTDGEIRSFLDVLGRIRQNLED